MAIESGEHDSGGPPCEDSGKQRSSPPSTDDAEAAHGTAKRDARTAPPNVPWRSTLPLSLAPPPLLHWSSHVQVIPPLTPISTLPSVEGKGDGDSDCENVPLASRGSSWSSASGMSRVDHNVEDSSSTARVTIKIFVNGWRKLRYPQRKISAGGALDRRAYASAPSLRSLLANASTAETTVSIRSESFADWAGCRWSVKLFPLGNPDQQYVGIFLDKESVGERHVRVEFRLHPRDGQGIGPSHNGECMVNGFRHRYIVAPGDWGLNNFFRSADVLRNHVTDEGCIVVSVQISNVALGRLPRLRRPLAMVQAQGGVENTLKSDGGGQADLCDETLAFYDADDGTNDEPRNMESDARWAGLKNQGATCYMNALLQIWYHLPALRHLLLSIPLRSEERVDSVSVSAGKESSAVLSSCADAPLGPLQHGLKENVNNDTDLPVSLSRQRTTSNTLPALDTELSQTGESCSAESLGRVSPISSEERVGAALQFVFTKLQLASSIPQNKSAVSTAALTTAFGWDSASLFRQQDVQELSRVLLDKLEILFKRMRPNVEARRRTLAGGADWQKRCLPDMFEGKLQSYVRCTSVRYESSKIETFLDLQLNVKGCPTLYDSLSQFSFEEDLTGDNQYDASDAGHGRQDAKKGVRIYSLPPVLNIHLKRFEFDSMTERGMVKVHDHLEFPVLLDMSDYVVDPDDGRQTKDQTTRENRNLMYHLHSIILHSGDAGAGHYFSYIRPDLESYGVASLPGSRDTAVTESPPPPAASFDHVRKSNSGWFKFDDEIVSPVHEDEVLDTAYGDQPASDSPGISRNSPVDEHEGDSNLWARARNVRLSFTERFSRVNENSSNLRRDGARKRSNTSAYMLTYICEADLPWVLGAESGIAPALCTDLATSAGSCPPLADSAGLAGIEFGAVPNESALRIESSTDCSDKKNSRDVDHGGAGTTLDSAGRAESAERTSKRRKTAHHSGIVIHG